MTHINFDSKTLLAGGAQTSAPAAPAPAAAAPTPAPAPVVGDLLGGSSAPPPAAQQPVSNDPFAQWTSSTSNNANTNPGNSFDSFDPFASAPGKSFEQLVQKLLRNIFLFAYVEKYVI